MGRNTLKYGAALICVLLVSWFCILQVDAVTLSNNITITADNEFGYGVNASVSGDKYSVWSLSSLSSKSQSIYINNSASTEQLVTINCDISVGSSSCYVTINGTNYSANATGKEISFTIAANSSSTIKLYAAKGKYTTAITFNSITSVTNVTSTVIFEPATGGSYTVAGSAITASTQKTCTANGLAVVATANSGYEFVAWVTVNSDGTYSEIVGLSASGTLRVGSDCTVKPLFAATTAAMYWVNGYIYDSWSGAFSAAETTYPVLLYKSGTLPAGTYTIETGQKLLIPYSATHYSDADLRAAAFGDPLDSTESGTLSAYRTLTLASGATISCSGQISVDAWQYSSSVNNTGRVAGPYGKIALNSGSAIDLNSGAVLYCYGYITGTGTVTANSGATVHELFQMMDWRGGNVAYNTYEDMEGDSFLISQFYIQNIESNLTVHYNANVIAHVTVAAALVGDKKPYASSMALIGNEGLFVLESGASVNRLYDTSDGRIKYEVSGKTKIDSITLTVTAALLSGNKTVTMHSSDYVLNIPSSMSITVKSGATVEIPNRIKLLPDTVLEIEEGGAVNLTSGTDSSGNTVNAELILYDYDDWTGGPDEYSWGCDFKAVNYSPSGKRMTALSGSGAKLIVNGTLNIGNGAAVYSTNDINASNGNSCLSGNAGGRIIWGTAPSSVRTEINELVSDTNGLLEVTVNGATTSYPPVDVVQLQAPIAGVSASSEDFTKSMSSAASADSPLTYHSTGSFWYNYTISVADGTAGVVGSGDSANFDKTYSAADPVVGYTSKGGTFTFTVTPPQCKAVDSVTASNGTLSESYTLTGVTADSVLTISLSNSHTEVTDAAVAPTCTATGKTEGKHCSVCNTVLVAQTEVAALGHTEVIDAAVDATCTETGLTEGKHCETCGEVLVKQEEVPTIEHTYDENGICACGWFKFYAANLRLGNDLDMMFAFPKGTDRDWTGCYVGYVRQKAVGAEETGSFNFGTWTEYDDYYYVTYDGFAAKEMCDTISLTVYNSEGQAISATWTDSIQMYAHRILNATTDPALIATVVDMLNYGAACQQLGSGYGTSNLANSKLTDAQKAYAGKYAKAFSDSYATAREEAYTTWNGSTLVTTSNIQFGLAFQNLPSDGFVVYSFKGHKGNDVSVTVKCAEIEKDSNGVPVILIQSLVVADARYPVTVKVYNSDNTLHDSWLDSIEAYACRMGTGIDDVFSAFMKFADSAHEYLHTKGTSGSSGSTT